MYFTSTLVTLYIIPEVHKLLKEIIVFNCPSICFISLSIYSCRHTASLNNLFLYNRTLKCKQSNTLNS